MKDSYDFSKGIKNPYASRLKKGYTVTVHYDCPPNDDNKDQAKKATLSNSGHANKKT